MENQERDNERLTALALDALDEAEARRVAAALGDDARLARDAAAWREIAAHLSCAAPAIEPSPECRARILAAIKNVKQDSAAENNVELENAASAPIKNFAEPAQANVVSFAPRRAPRKFFGYLPIAGAIAASLVAVFLAGLLFSSNEQIETVRREVAELTQKLRETEQKLNDTAARLERERQEREMLASPSSIVRALNGTADVPTAKARLVVDPKTNRALLFVENLPDAPAGKAYQIWWMNDPNKPAPGNTFKVAADGKGEMRDQVSEQFTGARIYAVTLEPEGGSASPTSAPVLVTSAS